MVSSRSRFRALPTAWLLVFLVPGFVGPVAAELQEDIDWRAFLSGHDLVWDRLAEEWYEAPFLGNGMMGTMIYKKGRDPLRFDVHRSDVQDHRDNSHGWSAYSRARLPIGRFELQTVGRIVRGTMRLHLYDAEATGVLHTERGTIEWRALVPTGRMGLVVEAKATGDERDFRWVFRPDEAISPRQAWRGDYTLEHRHGIEYKENPKPRVEMTENGGICEQPLLVGGGHATTWREVRTDDGRRILYASCDTSYPENDYRAKATALLASALEPTFESLVKTHQSWWHGFYPQSFISIPDTRLEGFYWIQIYKLASATRADQAIIDNHGPWLEDTRWPYATWNLNVQLTYWPCYASNRLDLGESMCRSLDNNFDNLIRNVHEPYRYDSAGVGRSATYDCIAEVGIPGRTDVGQYSVPEVGLLPWACHNYYLQYRFSMDESVLRRLFPIMRRAYNYYLHFLTPGSDGKLHLPTTFCPEYGNAPDNNFDLQLMRWGYATLLRICDRLEIDDPLIPRWKQVLKDLVPYPVDENGLMVGTGVPWAVSHRHYSHMLGFYPLYIIRPDVPADEKLIRKTLRHWLTVEGGWHHRGYSYTGPASMHASLGEGDTALAFINKLLDSESRLFLGQWIRPSTMYLESGPVIETPLSAAQSLHDMLLQSWGEEIRVFPAVPSSWKDAVIHNMRTEGAFLVTAVRRDGKTQLVRVRSLAGEPFRVSPGVEQAVVETTSATKSAVVSTGDGVYELNLAVGEEVVFFPKGASPDATIAPLPPERAKLNFYGVRY